MAQQTLNDLELGLSFRTKLNDNYDEIYGWLTGLSPLTGIDINGGTIDGTPIGATTPSTGAFTTLTATGINSTPIGATTPSTGAFTTLSATSMDSTPVGSTTPAAGTFTALVTTGDNIRIENSKTPASAVDTGTTGTVSWDSSYIYVCIATDTWVRAALATW